MRKGKPSDIQKLGFGFINVLLVILVKPCLFSFYVPFPLQTGLLTHPILGCVINKRSLVDSVSLNMQAALLVRGFPLKKWIIRLLSLHTYC